MWIMLGYLFKLDISFQFFFITCTMFLLIVSKHLLMWYIIFLLFERLFNNCFVREEIMFLYSKTITISRFSGG